MTRIVIPVHMRGSAWLGGMNYFRSLVRALRAHPSAENFHVTVLTNHWGMFGEPNACGIEIVAAPWLEPHGRVDYYLNGALKTSGLINPYLFQYARASGTALITHATVCHFNACPTLFWMPDFQHCHLPEYFSGYERARRSRNVRMSARSGHILFSSHSAAADFRSFFPDFPHVETHVLQFAPLLDGIGELPDKQALSRKHALPESYFFLPNQFWRHKNHQVVIEALRQLPDDIHVVCTGALSDSRGDRHVQDIRASIEQGALQQRFRILGVVPRADLLGLMKYALCILNPSFFEGWSSTVEEAKYMGKRMILSDLPVHREQVAEGALFFPARNSQALARAMRQVAEEYRAEQEPLRAEQGETAYAACVERFAAQYWDIARKIMIKGGMDSL